LLFDLKLLSKNSESPGVLRKIRGFLKVVHSEPPVVLKNISSPAKLSILTMSRKGIFFPVDIFRAIKSIQKINREILPHAEKNLLISIVIHIGENGNIWATNEQMGIRIGESKDYSKNLIMRLKNKGYLQVTGHGKNRRISVIERKIFGNSQLPKSEFGNSRLPVGNSQLPPYIKEKEKKNIKEKSKASPDFSKKLDLWNSIPLKIRRRLNKNQLAKFSFENIEYAIERMNCAIENGGSPIKTYQNALKGEHAKFARKMEDQQVQKQKQHNIDIQKICEEARKRTDRQIKDRKTLLDLAKKFQTAMAPVFDNYALDAIICNRAFKQFERNN
jgi:hypothetical protein